MESIVPEGMQWHYDDWHLSPLVKQWRNRLRERRHRNERERLVSVRHTSGVRCRLRKLGRVLGAGGLDFSNILEMTTFHIDMSAHLDTFREVRDSYLSEPWPAWSAIGTTELAVPGPRLEIKVACATGESTR